MRTFQDMGFELWETWVSSGEHGFSDRHPRILFRSRSEPQARAREVVLEAGDEADAQRRVLQAADEELRSLLAGAVPVA